MKDKTAALALFHDIEELPQQNEDPEFLDIEPEQPDGEPDVTEMEPAQQNVKSDPTEENYLPMNALPQLTGMVLPVWVFSPIIPFGVPVMALVPVLIYS